MNTQNNIRLHGVKVGARSPSNDSKEFEDFIYLLSHDVRSSLRALLELPQWIKDDLAAEGHSIRGSLAENFDLLEVHTRRIDRMLIDLLVYSRVGRMQTVQSVDLGKSVDSVLSQLPLPPGFKVTRDLDCQAVQIGDRDILTLLSALISNAIKHHHRDEGVIHISSQKRGNECVIRVQDDGPGIPEKHSSRVFEAMTTLRSRDEVEGSGMGLATVRKIVEFYGGRLHWISPDDAFQTCLEMCFQT